jgi:hypothetical protein
MSTKKDVFLECKYLAGYYPKAMKERVKNPVTGLYEWDGRELKFINGSAAVTQEELKILQEDPKWGLEFALRGSLGRRAIGHQVEVKKGVSPMDQIKAQVLAQGNPAAALKPDEVPESDEALIARLAGEHDETNETRTRLAGSEKPQRAKRTAVQA